MLTGYRWNTLKSELVADHPGCNNHQPLEELEAHPFGCGEPIGYFFVIHYIVLGKFIFLNMITVLVIDGYLESKKLEDLQYSEQEIEKLYKVWSEYDPEKTGMMKCDNFILFLHQVDVPFGVAQGIRYIKPSHIVNKFIYREDLKVIITIREVLNTAKQFPIHIYEYNGEYYVHFVDYISYATNKINHPLIEKIQLGADGSPTHNNELFTHEKLKEQWRLKFSSKLLT